MDKQTLGESRVLVKYSNEPEQLAKIAEIRRISASLIDLLDEHISHQILLSGLPFDGEQARVYATAMTEIEGACMWSIKAICK